MILTNMGLATNPTSFTKKMMSKIQSLIVFPVKKKIRKLNQLGFSLFSVAAKYYKVFLETKFNLILISFFTTFNIAKVQKEKKNQDVERQEFILRPLRFDDQLLQVQEK